MKLAPKFLSVAVVTCVMSSMAAPAFAVEAKKTEPTPYIVAGSTFLPKIAEGDTREYNERGQVKNSGTTFATPDVFATRAGEKVALDLFKNDTLAKGHRVGYDSLTVLNPATGEFSANVGLDTLGSMNAVKMEGNETIKPVNMFNTDRPVNEEGRSFLAVDIKEDASPLTKVYYKADVLNEKDEVIGEIQSYFIIGVAENVKEYCDTLANDPKADVVSPWSGKEYGEHFNPEKYAPIASPFCINPKNMNVINVTAGEDTVSDVIADNIPVYNYKGEISTTAGYVVNDERVFLKNKEGEPTTKLTIEGKGVATIIDGKIKFSSSPDASGVVNIPVYNLTGSKFDGDKKIDGTSFTIKDVSVSINVVKPEPAVEKVVGAPKVEAPAVEEEPQMEEDTMMSAQVMPNTRVAPVTSQPAIVGLAKPGDDEEKPEEPSTLVPLTPITPPIEIGNPSTVDGGDVITPVKPKAPTTGGIAAPTETDIEKVAVAEPAPEAIKDGAEDNTLKFFSYGMLLTLVIAGFRKLGFK